MIYIKIHHADNGKIVAMCDEEFLGMTLRDGKKELDLKKYASFYKDELVDEKKAVGILKGIEVYSANVVGKQSIKALQSKIHVDDSEIMKIKKVPYVHIYTLI